MSGQKRMAGILVVCFACAFILGCASAPSMTPEVIDTQAELSAEASAVASGAATLSDQAATLADTLGNMAQDNPEISPVAAIAASHATFAANHAKDTQELNKIIYTARMEVIELVKSLARSEKKRLKAEGQRNTAWMALAGIAAVLGVLVFFKIKKWFFLT